MKTLTYILMILFYIPTEIRMIFQKNNLKTISMGSLRLNDLMMIVFLYSLMLFYDETIYILVFFMFFLFAKINPLISILQLYYSMSSLFVFDMNLNLLLSILMLLSITTVFQILSSLFIYGVLFKIKFINKLLNNTNGINNYYIYLSENIENLNDEFILNNGKFIIITEKIEQIENNLKKIRDRINPKLYIYYLNSEVFNVIKEKKINYQITDNFNKVIFILFKHKFISLIKTKNAKKMLINDYISELYKKEGLFNFFKFSLFVFEKSEDNLTGNSDISSDEKKVKFIALKIVKVFFLFLMILIPVLILIYIPYVIFSVIHSKNSYARLRYEYIYSLIFIIYINIVFWGNDYLLYINISSYIFLWLGVYILFGLFNVGNMSEKISLNDKDYVKRKYNLIENINEVNIKEIEKKGYRINVFRLSYKDIKNLKYFINDYIDLYSYKFTSENFNYLFNNKNKKRFWHIVDKNGKVFLYVLPSGKIFIEQFKEENIKYYDDLATQCYKEINFIDLFLSRNFYKNEKLKNKLKKLLNIYTK